MKLAKKKIVAKKKLARFKCSLCGEIVQDKKGMWKGDSLVNHLQEHTGELIDNWIDENLNDCEIEDTEEKE